MLTTSSSWSNRLEMQSSIRTKGRMVCYNSQRMGTFGQPANSSVGRPLLRKTPGFPEPSRVEGHQVYMWAFTSGNERCQGFTSGQGVQDTCRRWRVSAPSI